MSTVSQETESYVVKTAQHRKLHWTALGFELLSWTAMSCQFLVTANTKRANFVAVFAAAEIAVDETLYDKDQQTKETALTDVPNRIELCSQLSTTYKHCTEFHDPFFSNYSQYLIKWEG